MAQKLAYAQSLATLQQRHPDLESVMNSEGFKTWDHGKSRKDAPTPAG